MPPEERSVGELFDEAIRRPPGKDRAAYLDAACGEDLEKRQRVERLLQASVEAGSFLESPAADASATIDQPMSEMAGAQIGPYKLLQQIGEGGMGVVYLAQQSQPVNRRVALKVIKPGMDSRQVIARFEAERQALALMDHPNIAKVFDAATTESGRPYFVMELVKGIPLTDYCDEQHLAPKERLQLFIPVCQAVQHAHQKGIIHRDLKPSNVLVALYDGQPVPKVIDFGVAKATNQQLTEKTMFTAVGQIVGTLEYMSPEQAQVNQLDIDTRSDIYSLGVLLYELLTGVTPFDRARLRSAAFDELLRIIREEEPPRPSARLSTIDTLPSVAANRRSEPQKLRTLVRGELDWLVMKALEKDRARRYQTANGFAADIQHYLNNEPVVACPPSTAYRFRKFARRNKLLLTSTVLIALALNAGAAVATWQAFVATRATLRAEEAEQEQRQLASDNRLLAENERRAREEAENNSLQLKKQLNVATGMRLAAQSQLVRTRLPVQSVLLAAEAVKSTASYGEPTVALAHQALLNAVLHVGGTPLLSTVAWTAASPDRRWVLTVDDDGSASLWDLAVSNPSSVPVSISRHETVPGQAVISPDGRWLVTGGVGDHESPGLLADLTSDIAARVLPGHEAGLSSAKMSPNGHFFVTVDKEYQTTFVWDLTSEDPLLTPRILTAANVPSPQTAYEGPIGEIAIGPDGRWVATGGQNRSTALLWDLHQPERDSRPFVLRGHEGLINNAFSFSGDGRRLATGGDRTVRLWDLMLEDPSDSPVVCRGHQFAVVSVALSQNGNWMATASRKSRPISESDAVEVLLWDLTAKDPSGVFRRLIGHTETIWSLMFSADSRWLLSASRDHTAMLWDLRDSKPRPSPMVLTGHEGPVQLLAIGPGSRWLLTKAKFGRNLETLSTVRLWDLRAQHRVPSPLELPSVRDRTQGQSQMVITPDSRWLAAGHPDGTVRLWELPGTERATRCRILRGHQGPVRSIRISRDGRWLVTGSSDQTVHIWDLSDQPRPSIELTGHTGPVREVLISPNGDWIVSVSGDEVRVWQWRDEIPDLVSVLSDCYRAVVAINNHWLITARQRTRIEGDYRSIIEMRKLGEAVDSTPISLGEAGHHVRAIAVTPDGRWLVVGIRDKTAQIWDLSADDPGSTRRVLSGHTNWVVGVAITPDGRWLATSSDDRTARLWDLGSKKSASSVKIFRGHENYAWTVAMSHDGCWLATGSADQTVRLWDLRTSDSHSARILKHTAGVPSLLFSPNGRWLATQDGDGTIRLWDLDVDSLLQRASVLAGRKLSLEEREQYSLGKLEEVRLVRPNDGFRKGL